MRLPDFLIIGAARCGTTSLCENLKCHPQIYLPVSLRPEPHFFLKDHEYRKGLAYYSSKYFKDVPEDVLAGEKSVSYIYQPYVAERIKTHLPDVKLICMLRNPIDRAYSSYQFTRANGLEDLPFDQAIRSEAERIAEPPSHFHAEVQPFAYIDRGRYHQQLERYLAVFPAGQLHVAILEDLCRDPENQLRKILEFLGAHADFVPPNLGEIFNPGNYGQQAMAQAERDYIYQQLKDDIQALSAMLGKSLDHWL